MLSDASSVILSDTNSDRYSHILPVEEIVMWNSMWRMGNKLSTVIFKVIYCTLPPESMNVLAYL